jgi:hypothetical protein
MAGTWVSKPRQCPAALALVTLYTRGVTFLHQSIFDIWATTLSAELVETVDTAATEQQQSCWSPPLTTVAVFAGSRSPVAEGTAAITAIINSNVKCGKQIRVRACAPGRLSCMVTVESRSLSVDWHPGLPRCPGSLPVAHSLRPTKLPRVVRSTALTYSGSQPEGDRSALLPVHCSVFVCECIVVHRTDGTTDEPGSLAPVRD